MSSKCSSENEESEIRTSTSQQLMPDEDAECESSTQSLQLEEQNTPVHPTEEGKEELLPTNMFATTQPHPSDDDDDAAVPPDNNASSTNHIEDTTAAGGDDHAQQPISTLSMALAAGTHHHPQQETGDGDYDDEEEEEEDEDEICNNQKEVAEALANNHDLSVSQHSHSSNNNQQTSTMDDSAYYEDPSASSQGLLNSGYQQQEQPASLSGKENILPPSETLQSLGVDSFLSAEEIMETELQLSSSSHQQSAPPALRSKDKETLALSESENNPPEEEDNLNYGCTPYKYATMGYRHNAATALGLSQQNSVRRRSLSSHIIPKSNTFCHFLAELNVNKKLCQTDEALKKAEAMHKKIVNDDDQYPDSVTPTKVEHCLSSSRYDVPYIDDEAFYCQEWYVMEDHRWSRLEPSLEDRLTPLGGVAEPEVSKVSTSVSTPVKSPLTHSSAMKMASRESLLTQTEKPPRKRPMALCGCMRKSK